MKSPTVSKGVITMTSQNIKVGGSSDDFTLILNPEESTVDVGNDKALKWNIDKNSTCKTEDLR